VLKKILATTAVLVALPVVSQAQTLQYPGFYIGAIGGVNWQLNNSFTTTVSTPFGAASANTNANWNTGWAAGGMIGYDFVGPRVEVEGMYRDNTGTLTLPGVGGGGVAAVPAWTSTKSRSWPTFCTTSTPVA
jgi:OOP family OmpA-OmpF porin